MLMFCGNSRTEGREDGLFLFRCPLFLTLKPRRVELNTPRGDGSDYHDAKDAQVGRLSAFGVVRTEEASPLTPLLLPEHDDPAEEETELVGRCGGSPRRPRPPDRLRPALPRRPAGYEAQGFPAALVLSSRSAGVQRGQTERIQRPAAAGLSSAGGRRVSGRPGGRGRDVVRVRGSRRAVERGGMRSRDGKLLFGARAQQEAETGDLLRWGGRWRDRTRGGGGRRWGRCRGSQPRARGRSRLQQRG